VTSSRVDEDDDGVSCRLATPGSPERKKRVNPASLSLSLSFFLRVRLPLFLLPIPLSSYPTLWTASSPSRHSTHRQVAGATLIGPWQSPESVAPSSSLPPSRPRRRIWGRAGIRKSVLFESTSLFRERERERDGRAASFRSSRGRARASSLASSTL